MKNLNDAEAQITKLRQQLKRSRAKVRKLQAQPLVVHEKDKKQPYSITAGREARSAAGGDRRLVVLVAGADVGEILKKIA